MSRHYLQGRIFDRARHFAALSVEQQEDTKACEKYLIEKKDEVFAMHHSSPFRTVYSVRGKHLLEKIEGWLKDKKVVDEVVAQPLSTNAVPLVDDNPPAVAHASMTNDPENGHPVVDAVPSTNPPPSLPSTSTLVESLDELKERRNHAKELMAALLWNGCMALHKEWNGEYIYKDSDLYLPLSKDVVEWSYVSVWEAVQHAVFAAPIKRKIGLFAPFTQGKESYIVVQEKMLYLYENDTVPTRPLVVFDTTAMETYVSYDTSHFTHGIKLWNTETTELFNARDKLEQDWLINAMVSTGSGVQYREATSFDVSSISSLYGLKEKDLEGGEVVLDQHKGKVVLIVNVSSDCPSTALHYSELKVLDDKYRPEGLIILGCPCDQFGGLEPGTPVEIQDFIQRLGVEFMILEKRDVNGIHARPLFTYLNAKLPGPHGHYVDWNFTKFLVDRQGQPVKRFTPEETPLSFEDAIVELLEQDPPVDPLVAALDAATGVVEPVDAATAVAAVATGEDVVDVEPKVVDKAAHLLDEEEVEEEEESTSSKVSISSTKQVHGEMNPEMGPTALYS